MDAHAGSLQKNELCGDLNQCRNGICSIDYFNWKQSIGPLSGRTEQWAGGWTGSEMVPKFGLDEFMDFVVRYIGAREKGHVNR